MIQQTAGAVCCLCIFSAHAYGIGASALPLVLLLQAGQRNSTTSPTG